MTSCNRSDCDGPGLILDSGFCDTCRRRPLSDSALERDRAQASPASRESSAQREGSFIFTSNIGGLVALPVLTLVDPSDRVLTTDTALAEERRRCSASGCGAEVGRSRRGRPGLPDGYCHRCRTRYSYSLKLHRGDTVDDRYEIRGPLEHGGFGWVYLAHDLHLDQLVVLKGLVNTEDQRARELATNEKNALIALDHPNLVRIHDFVQHPDPISGDPLDYIVMEYVGGPTLFQMMRDPAWRAEHGALTPEHVITYVLEILSALDYLHGVGLLYCDMKPANAIRSGDRLKVIDFNAVSAIDGPSRDSVGTLGYRVSDEEIDQHGLTVRSDLHTVGRTLQVLYQATDDWRVQPKPVALRSLEHIYERAMDDYHRRFGSAAEMAEQLTGVLRDIVALHGGELRPSPSTLFDEPITLLDAGLAAIPSLSRWTDAPANPDRLLADGRPSPPAVARGLPVPSVRADDEGAVYLSTLTVTDPQALAELLTRPSTPPSVEVHLRACRAMIELHRLDCAARQLDAAHRLLGDPEAAVDWRFTWHRGLIDLADDNVNEAMKLFEAVYRDLPGEVAPKLALGFCAEHGGNRAEAERFYEAVWLRERLQVSAAFGLARIRLVGEGRSAAVSVLDEVGENSRYVEAARSAAIMVLSGRLAPSATRDGLPTAADLSEAAARLDALKWLDGGEREGPLRARLTAVLRTAALGLAARGGLSALCSGEVFGDPPSERVLCTLLETTFRRLAEQARDAEDHGVLVDRANAVRPHSWW